MAVFAKKAQRLIPALRGYADRAEAPLTDFQGHQKQFGAVTFRDMNLVLGWKSKVRDYGRSIIKEPGVCGFKVLLALMLIFLT